jgi:osmotically-inducible protein OsmY
MRGKLRTLAALSAGAALAGAAVWRRRSEAPDDEVLEARVRAEVLEPAGNDRITLRVDRGVVTLRGDVDTLAAIGEVALGVQGVAGVREVRNLLRLRPTAAIRQV